MLDGLVDRLLFKPVASSYDLEFSDRKRFLIAVRGPLSSRPGHEAYVPCIAAPASEPCRTLVVHFHGTGGDIAKSGPWFDVQRRMPVHVVSVEYPGYGCFPGYHPDIGAPMPPSEASVLDAGRIVAEHVRDVWGWPLENVIISGRSMGSGPASVLAAELQPGGCTILSGFASLQELAVKKMRIAPIARWLCRERFFNEARLRDFKGHGFVFHGGADTLIPPSHGRRSYAALAASSATRDLVIDPTGTHWQVRIVDPLVAFVRRFEAEAATGAPREMPVERFQPDGADGIGGQARAWLTRAAERLSQHRRRRRIQIRAVGTAVFLAVIAFVWRRYGQA